MASRAPSCGRCRWITQPDLPLCSLLSCSGARVLVQCVFIAFRFAFRNMSFENTCFACALCACLLLRSETCVFTKRTAFTEHSCVVGKPCVLRTRAPEQLRFSVRDSFNDFLSAGGDRAEGFPRNLDELSKSAGLRLVLADNQAPICFQKRAGNVCARCSLARTVMVFFVARIRTKLE